MLKTFVYSLSLALTLVSCSHKPLIKSDFSLPLPSHFSKQLDLKTTPGPWWKSFDNPLLDETIEKAFKQNRELKIAWHRLNQRKIALQQHKSKNFPQLHLALQAQRQKNSHPPITSPSKYHSSFLLAPELSYEIDLFHKLKHGTLRNQHLIQASEYEWQATYLSLSASIAKLWIEQLLQQNLYELTKQHLNTQQNRLKLLKLNASNQEIPTHYYLKQKALVEGQSATLPKIQEAYNQLQQQLKLLSGEKEFFPEEMSLFSLPLPALPPLPSAYSPKNLLFYRPDVKAYYQRVLALDEGIAESLKSHYPSLSLHFLSQFTASRIEDLFSTHLLNLGFQSLTPIFTGGRIEKEVEGKKEELKEALEGLKLATATAVKEIETHLEKEKQLLAAHKKLQDKLSTFKETHELAKQGYVLGIQPYENVLTTLSEWQQLQLQILNSHSQLLLNRVNLHMALGDNNPLPLL